MFKTRKGIIKLLFILIVISLQTVKAQDNKISDCKLQENNKLWKIKYKKSENKNEKISLIKEKIQFDSLFTPFTPKIRIPHSATITNEHIDNNGSKCGGKILFILYHKKMESIFLNLNEKPNLSSLVSKINTENIKQIDYLESETARAVYGTRAKYGVIILRTDDRNLKKTIKKTDN